MSRIYTRGGDDGYTWCSRSRRRVPKTHPCIEFVGALDEAEAALGLARSLMRPGDDELAGILLELEDMLFRVGFAFSTGKACITNQDLERVEVMIDSLSSEIEPVFTMNPGYPAAAAVSLARAVTRRAERRYWACLEALGEQGELDRLAGRILNRVSDLLYVVQLLAAKQHGDRPPRATCSGLKGEAAKRGQNSSLRRHEG